MPGTFGQVIAFSAKGDVLGWLCVRYMFFCKNIEEINSESITTQMRLFLGASTV